MTNTLPRSYLDLLSAVDLLRAEHKDDRTLQMLTATICHHAEALVGQRAEAIAAARRLRDAFNPLELAAAGRTLGLLECQERDVGGRPNTSRDV